MNNYDNNKNKKNIFDLPEELINEIYCFTEIENNMFDVCKDFWKLKKSYYHYILTKNASLKYYNKNIKLKAKYIHLNLRKCKNITDVSMLTNLKILHINKNSNIKDINVLENNGTKIIY